ncbi:unnamed protein product [Adineta ricciae]|uniref:Snake toxin/toxin-like domain-containing protein n=1 Tax=Adineta ricciae TaxID=249248 RepID=A0A814QFT3_ADIRI|nr:unnamed protein product [Adineta ricciae]
MHSKVILGFLINLLLFLEIHAQPTSCVTCINCQDQYDGTDTNSTCASTAPNADSCQKMRIQLPGAVLIAKACAKNCKEQTIVAGILRFDVTCCTTDNCNQGKRHSPGKLFLLIILVFLLKNKH